MCNMENDFKTAEELKNKGTDVYEFKPLLFKLKELRRRFRECPIEKTGINSYLKSNNTYYKLEDILKYASPLLDDLNLVTLYVFEGDDWSLRLLDLDTMSNMEFTLPKPVIINTKNFLQEMGKSQTYYRKYLYMQLLDLSEVDVVDRDAGKDAIAPKKGGKKPFPTDNPFSKANKDPTRGNPNEQQKLKLKNDDDKLQQLKKQLIKIIEVDGNDINKEALLSYAKEAWKNKKISPNEYRGLKQSIEKEY